jgi:hypothetical protein
MSCALTVSPRSLDLPLGALFSPTEMQIGPSTSQAEYQKLGAGLRKLDNASELWTADFSLFGLRTWGKEQGLQLAHDATGLSKFFLYKTSFVAARFAPEHRLPGYKYSAYRELMPFPPEWAYEFLARHAGEKLSSKSLRALAVKEFGSEPYKAKQPKKRNVSVRCELYARLAQHSPSQKVASFIEQILGDWIRHREGPPLTDAEKQQRYRERHPERNAEIQKRWREQQGKTAATTHHDDKQHPFAPTATVGARPSSGNDKQSTSAQPKKTAAPESPKPSRWRSFSEAREYVRGLHLSGSSEWQSWSASEARPRDIPSAPQVIYAGQWIDYADWLGKTAVLTVDKSRKQKPCQCKVNSAYVTCTGKPLSSKLKPTWFVDREAAEQGNREFEACHGYLERIVYCRFCLAWHLQHIFSGEVQEKPLAV